MNKQFRFKLDYERYFNDLVRDLESSNLIASVTVIDTQILREKPRIEWRRYRAYLEHNVSNTKEFRHNLMNELQVAVSPTPQDHTIEIIGVYRLKHFG